MKNIFLLLSFLFCAAIAFAQTPSHFKYQGVARDANNQAFVNTALGLKVSIVLDNGSGSGSGLVEYSEKHLAFTSPVGVFSLNIGDGQTIFGDIEEINWASGAYWLKVEMDVNGGEDYVYMGNSPILPVPIAVHALTVADKDDADADPNNEIQNISFDPNSNQLSISGGNTINIPAGQADADADPNNEIQTLQFNANNNTLSLTNGGQVDLSSLVGGDGGTDDQNLQLNGTTLSIEGGNQVDLANLQDGTEDADADPQNEIQSLQLNGTTLSIEGGNNVNLAAIQDGTEDADANPQNELQTISFDPNTNQLTISEGNTINIPAGQADADADPQNEIQTLQFDANSNTLSLSDGGQVDLSSLEDGGGGTDDQTLQLNGTTLVIEGGNQVDLANLQDGTEDADANPQNELQTISFDPNTNQLTISEGNSINIPAGQADADADPQNEIQTLTFDADNNTLMLSGGGQVDLSSLEGGGGGTDDQTLQLNGTTLVIEGGNQVDLANIQDGTEDADADPSNEIQTISFDPNTNQLSISAGNTINIPAGEADADADPENELQDLQLNGTTLSIEGGNNVNLAAIQDGTEDADADPNNEIQTLEINLETNLLSLSNGGGQIDVDLFHDGVTDADSNPTNELQSLSFDPNTNELSISAGNTINIPAGQADADADPTNEIQSLDYDGLNNTLTIEGGNTIQLLTPFDPDPSPTNELQDLQLNGTTLSIEGGNNVNLAVIQDGTEDADSNPTNELQSLSFDANTNELSLSSGNTINLPIDVDDNDHSPINELQTLSLNGTNLNLSQGGQVDLSAVQDGTEDADADPTNEIQGLIYNSFEQSISIEEGNTIHLLFPSPPDLSPTNELQTISLNGNILNLNQGGGQVDLSGLGGGSSLWSQAADNDLYTQESVAIGFAESQLSTLEVKEDITIRKANGNIVHDFFSNSTGGHMYLYKGNATGGSNDLLVNIDAAQSGGLINLRNDDGSIRGEWQVGSSDSHLNLSPPDLDLGIEMLASNTGTSVALGLPNGSEGIRLSSSLFGSYGSFSGSTGDEVASIGRDGGSPTSGLISVGNSSNSQMLQMYVSDSDGVGTRAGWFDGFTDAGDQIFRLGSFSDVTSRGYLSIFDDNGNEAVSVRGSRGGEVVLTGAISKNVVIGTTTNSTDLGRISVYDAFDDESAGFYTDFGGNGIVFADIKNFRMDHPADDSKEIWYACVEGPEAAAYERGTSELINGEAVINFPDHFGLVANHETMTVMLTPLSADCKGLAVVEKTATGFKVKELFQGTGTYSFDWEVKCVRKGYENYEPIREKKDRM